LVKLAEAVDSHIEASGGLAGLIIEAAGFPGWDGWADRGSATMDPERLVMR
jgi:hypothetical protein